MDGLVYLDQVRQLSVGDVDVVGINCTDYLDSGELLTGTPTITEITTSDLTFANQAVSTTALTIDGATVAIGMAIQFKVSGQQAGKKYKVKYSCGTDATPARTVVRGLMFEVPTS